MLLTKLKSFKRRHNSQLFALEMALSLFLFAFVAGTGEAKAEEWKYDASERSCMFSTCEGTFKLHYSVHSVHYQDNGTYNNKNYGIYLEYNDIFAGVFKNSYGDTAGVVGYNGGTIEKIGPIDVGWTVGVAVGYEQFPVIPSPALTFTWDRVRIVATPVVSTLVVQIAEF